MICVDCEVYKDYFLLAALHIGSGKTKFFEMYPQHPLDDGIKNLLVGNTTVGFNSINYDLPILSAALRGCDNMALKIISDSIIKEKKAYWKLGIKVPRQWDHIDLIELAIGQSSLKIYGGRLNAPKMQDLPIEPDASISASDRKTLRDYCVNDLETTAILYHHLKPQIDLRCKLSDDYNVDVRSKSDAQIAEVVIKSELEHISDCDTSKPNIRSDFRFRYADPGFIRFSGEAMSNVYGRLLETDFPLAENGSVEMPDLLKNQRINIGDGQYQMGIGGLHSCEKQQYVEAGSDMFLSDWDVASYYPNIILGQKLAPTHLGNDFLSVFESIVERRINAKRRMQEIEKEIAELETMLDSAPD